MLKNSFLVASNGRRYKPKLARAEITAAAKEPARSEKIMMFRFCFTSTRFTTEKYIITAATTVIAWGSAIMAEFDRYEERRTAVPKAKIGRLSGFLTKVSLFSVIDFKQYSNSSINAPATTRICFGKVKNSVVFVKNKIGKSSAMTAITTVAIELIMPE